jgi:hypothetical protein
MTLPFISFFSSRNKTKSLAIFESIGPIIEWFGVVGWIEKKKR